jgi:hypothetical protein
MFDLTWGIEELPSPTMEGRPAGKVRPDLTGGVEPSRIGIREDADIGFVGLFDNMELPLFCDTPDDPFVGESSISSSLNPPEPVVANRNFGLGFAGAPAIEPGTVKAEGFAALVCAPAPPPKGSSSPSSSSSDKKSKIPFLAFFDASCLAF